MRINNFSVQCEHTVWAKKPDLRLNNGCWQFYSIRYFPSSLFLSLLQSPLFTAVAPKSIEDHSLAAWPSCLRCQNFTWGLSRLYLDFLNYNFADPSGRAFWGVGLRPFASWDCGFESHGGHECLSVVNVVCSQVATSATSRSLLQTSPIMRVSVTEFYQVQEKHSRRKISRMKWPELNKTLREPWGFVNTLFVQLRAIRFNCRNCGGN